MWVKRQRGLTLIEMVMAIVIIGVGLAGVLAALRVAVRGSADPLPHKQMVAIAEQLMEEITLQPYAPAASAITAFNTCARNAFNDIHDYNNYKTTAGYCDVDGNPIASLAAYNVQVTVNSTITLNGIGSGDAAEITVKVTHGGNSFSLVGWRTFYAKP